MLICKYYLYILIYTYVGHVCVCIFQHMYAYKDAYENVHRCTFLLAQNQKLFKCLHIIEWINVTYSDKEVLCSNENESATTQQHGLLSPT